MPVPHISELVAEKRQRGLVGLHVEKFCLLSVHHKPESVFQFALNPLNESIRPLSRENHEVVRVAHDRHDLVGGLGSQHGACLEPMQVDVRQQRGDYSALRRPLPFRVLLHSVRLDAVGLQPLSDERQHAAVRDARSQGEEQFVVRYRVEVGRKVCIIDLSLPRLHLRRYPVHRLLCRAVWPEPERAVVEVRLEYRLDDEFDRALHHPVLYGGDAERSQLAIRLLDVLPSHGACAVGLFVEFLLNPRDERFRAALGLLDVLNRHAVHPGRALVRADLRPRALERLGFDDEPLEVVEPKLRFVLRLYRQFLPHERKVRIANETLPRGNLADFLFRIGLRSQAACPHLIETFPFTRRGPSLHGHCPASTLLWPRPTPADAFAPQVSQVPDATFQTRRPSMPRHAFCAANRLRRFFSASRRMTRWPHGVLTITRLNGKGSLALRLACL